MDTMIVGNFLGDTSLAAIGAFTAIYDLLIGFALGVGNGLSIVVARSYGVDDEQLLKRSVAGSIVIGMLLTIEIMIFSKIGLYPLLQLLNTLTNIINEAYSYTSLITLFVRVMFDYNLFSGLLRTIGNSVMPLAFLMISSLINVILDLVFIHYFHLGIKGAAIATVIAQGISAVLCLIYIYKKCPLLIPHKEHFTYDKNLYHELAGQSFSRGGMMAIVSTGTVILQTAINKFGYLVIAGHTTARKLNNFCMMPVSTLGLALSTFISQNKGANQGVCIRQSIKYANGLAITWSIVITFILALTAPMMAKLLSGSSEEIVIENATLYLMINAPFYCIVGRLFNLRNALQGLGRKVIPLVSSIIEFFGKIIFVSLFIPLLGYFGVIICKPIIWCLMCIQLVYDFYQDSYIREYKRS